MVNTVLSSPSWPTVAVATSSIAGTAVAAAVVMATVAVAKHSFFVRLVFSPEPIWCLCPGTATTYAVVMWNTLLLVVPVRRAASGSAQGSDFSQRGSLNVDPGHGQASSRRLSFSVQGGLPMAKVVYMNCTLTTILPGRRLRHRGSQSS